MGKNKKLDETLYTSGFQGTHTQKNISYTLKSMLFSNLVSVDMLTENVEGFKAEFVLHNIFNSSY